MTPRLFIVHACLCGLDVAARPIPDSSPEGAQLRKAGASGYVSECPECHRVATVVFNPPSILVKG